MESKVTKEMAQSEFDRWFESKKLPKTRREGDALPLVEEMVSAIEEGTLVIDEENKITQVLKFPIVIAQREPVKELVYVNRVQAGTLASRTAWAKDDKEQKLIAKISVLTGCEAGVIRALDSIDHQIASIISAFY